MVHAAFVPAQIVDRIQVSPSRYRMLFWEQNERMGRVHMPIQMAHIPRTASPTHPIHLLKKLYIRSAQSKHELVLNGGTRFLPLLQIWAVQWS